VRKSSGFVDHRGHVNHCASKAGIFDATIALALEMGKRKIAVNCVSPGTIETDMLEDALIGENEK